MIDQGYYIEARPTDNSIAALQNLLHFLNAPISHHDIEKAVYNHPDFPFISLQHLSDILKDLHISAVPIRVIPEMLSQIELPTIAYTNKNHGTFIILYKYEENSVLYLHPAIGWISESLQNFKQHWPGVLLNISHPSTFNIIPQSVMHEPRVGIALTLVNAEKTLVSFIQYHLHIGFDHIFLFFDKPDDPSTLIVEQFSQVTIIKRDASLEESWKACRLYEQFKQQMDRPEARQLLNMEIAIQMAIEHRLDWLLQIDVDELFYSPYKTIKEHFTTLMQEQVYQVTYMNYEAVSQTVEVEDYFKEVTLFKKNPAVLNQTQRKVVLEYNVSNVNPWFLAYSNGKSAARVEKHLLPWGNHHFQLQQGLVTYQKKHQFTVDYPSDSPIILHYAECGFSHFCNKYNTWGNFPDTFLGGQPIIDYVPFRIAARNVISTGNEQLIRSFYEKLVVLQDTMIIDRFLKEEIFCQITGPSNILKN